MSITKEAILKAILLQEFDRMQPEISTFEDDPMQFILRKYPGLNETLTYLMTPSFQEYITGIYIVAPKPTTFKVVLHNGQFFFLQFTGKTYQATVVGKNYYLMSIGEKERCMLAIARLLRYGNPIKTKGPEGAEQGTRDAGEVGGETAGGEETPEVPEASPEEEPIAEARILAEILKKKLSGDQNIDTYSTTLRASELGRKPKVGGFTSIGRFIYYLIYKKEGILVSDDKNNLQNAYKVVLNFKEGYDTKFYNQEYKEIKDNDLIFFDSKNKTKEYAVSNIVKTKDFGGVVKDATKKHERPTAKSLQSQIDQIKEENKISGIKIKVGEKTYDDISHVEVKEIPEGESETRQPKGDIIFFDSDGKEKIFASHKLKSAGKGEKGGKGGQAFIAWSAIKTSTKNIQETPEIEAFAEALKSLAKKKLGSDWENLFINEETKKTYYTSITEDLKLKSVYGKDFASEDFGINNVQIVVQGDLNLKQIENSDEYKFEGYEKIWINGPNPDIPTGEYEPFLVAKFSGSGKAFGFKNCISYITTKKNISGNSEFVNTTFNPNTSDQVKQSKKSTKIGAIPIPKESAIRIVNKGESVILVKNSWIENQMPKYFKRTPEGEKKLKDYKAYFISKDTGYSKNFSVLDPKRINKFEIEGPELKEPSAISTSKKPG